MYLVAGKGRTANLVAEMGNAPIFTGYQPGAHACRLFRIIHQLEPRRDTASRSPLYKRGASLAMLTGHVGSVGETRTPNRTAYEAGHLLLIVPRCSSLW